MNRPLPLVSGVVLLGLASCASPVVISAEGPATNISDGQFGQFSSLYNTALKTNDTQDATRLLSSGMSLIDVNCRDYFRREGRFQQVLYFTRDTANVLAPIAAGALALAKESTNAVAILTLSTTATAGLISTIASDFLFNANNIDDVQTLVMTELSSHEDGVNQNVKSNPNAVTFDWAVQQLADHQNRCLPAHILSITKQAIRSGVIQSYNEGSTTPGVSGQPSPQSVQNLESSLSKIVGGTMNDDETAALYWLVEKSDAAKYYKDISAKLQSLGTNSPFANAGALKATWTQSLSGEPSLLSQVKGVFDGISDPLLRGKLEAQIGSWVAAKGVTPARAPRAFGAVPLPSASLRSPAPPPVGTLPSHVGTRVISP
jgi:hypothetical protein